MKWFVLALFVALSIIATSTRQANAQLGESHFRAWDQHSGKARTTTRRSAVRVAKRRTSIQARVSPGIARTPIVHVARAVEGVAGQILPHPAGCPTRLFCGCGAAIEVFGRPVRELWLAAAWLKFPPASPGPGMVAANRRHVMVIRQMVGPNTALVYDANSGQGKTRLHVRSLAGYRIVNPRA